MSDNFAHSLKFKFNHPSLAPFLQFYFKYQGELELPMKIRIYLNCPGLHSSLEGISLVPIISDRRLLVHYKLRPPLIGLRRISCYEAVFNHGRKNVIFRPSMTIWGRSFLLQIIFMGCWTHINQEPSNHSLALPPNVRACILIHCNMEISTQIK